MGFRTERLKTLIAITGIFALAAAAGCGGGGTGGGSQIPAAGSGSQQHNTGQFPLLTSSATAWQVEAGGEHRDGALQALAMLPATITIHEGDSVTWDIEGEPHTVTFFGPFTAPPGDPTIPQGGSTYDGTTFASSGILPPGQHYTLTFTKAGTYAYGCVLHPPEMSGVVIVKPRGTLLPFPQGVYTGEAKGELNGILREADASVKALKLNLNPTLIAAGVAPGGASAPPSKATVLRFLNGDRVNATTVTIPVGTTLTWTNMSNNEPHTVTLPQAGQPLPPLPGDPFTPPMGGSSYDGSQVTNSGVINPGQSYSLTFTKAGTYPYVCLFHDDVGMIGTVVVK